LAAQRNVSREQLAQAIERTGLSGDRALSAIDNWMKGRDHPRCKATDIAKLAAAVGAAPKDIARFVSEVRHHRGSPRKAKLLVDLVRGKSVDEALNLLTFTTKRAAVNVKKALNAAIADAERAEADVTALYIVESRVDDGGMIKRFQPKDRGRAHPIEKRLSHITIGLEEKARA
jgi:large subunit ribosomal protein L22